MHPIIRTSAFLATALTLLAADPTPSDAQTRTPSIAARDTGELMRRLRALAAESGGTVGIHAWHLESGETVGLRASEPFFMASVTKFPLAVHVLRQVERGAVSLADSVTITPAQMSPGPGVIRTAYPRGGTLTVDALLRAAVSDSDNPANDALQRLTGGPAAVTRTLESLGIRGISVDRPYLRLANEATARRAPGDRRDTATPEAMTALLDALWKGRALNRAGTARLLGLMTDTRNPARRIVAGVPAGTVVAHKTGTWDTPTGQGLTAINDVGIITLPNGRGHLAVAIFVRDTPRNMDQMEPVMARITRALFERWR